MKYHISPIFHSLSACPIGYLRFHDSRGQLSRLQIKDGDRISSHREFIGQSACNTAGGWSRQSQSERKHLVVRNLGTPGDQVRQQPRNKGFMTPEEYLTHCEADIIFAMFGYNRSFAGEAGFGSFLQVDGRHDRLVPLISNPTVDQARRHSLFSHRTRIWGIETCQMGWKTMRIFASTLCRQVAV